MGKFEIEFEITGLKLKVKGDRSEVPGMTQAIGQQIAGLFQPMNEIVDGEAKVIEEKSSIPIQTPNADEHKPKKKRRSPKLKENGNGSQSTQATNYALDWRHDPQKYNSPVQSWSLVQKVIWLMYVLQKEMGSADYSSKQLVETFNKHFKEAKTIGMSQLNRDLGKVKQGSDALVGQDNSEQPSTWFLTQNGKMMAEKLISGN
jgi:hypothetical protein